MQSMNRFKMGGIILATGASLTLLVKLYWILFPGENLYSITYRIISHVFGFWFALLVSPPSFEGTTIGFNWISLVWIPWAAVFILFLLWIAMKVIRGRFKSDSVSLPVLGVLGSWFIFGLLYDRISSGFYFFEFDLKLLLPMLLSDLAVITMIIGIGLILFSYKEATITAPGIQERSSTNSPAYFVRTSPITVSEALFSFRGRMSRSDYWLKGVLVLLPIGIFNNMLAFGVDNDGVYVLAIIIGVVSIWPSLALMVKRLHDRNHSGLFTATLLIPLVNIIFMCWILVEVWFISGTVGPNRFGNDTLLLNEVRQAAGHQSPTRTESIAE